MKITKTFENATLRTVNNGYIEVDYNGRTDCFHNASVVSVNNGSISIEIDWKPEKGELVKVLHTGINCYVIFDKINAVTLFTFGSKDICGQYYKLSNDSWVLNRNTKFYPVTPKEQQAFDDFCKSQGKIWNKEKLQWENYRWSPKPNEQYWYVASWGEVTYRQHLDTEYDQCLLQLGNAFPTKEHAEKVRVKMVQFFKSL